MPETRFVNRTVQIRADDFCNDLSAGCRAADAALASGCVVEWFAGGPKLGGGPYRHVLTGTPGADPQWVGVNGYDATFPSVWHALGFK